MFTIHKNVIVPHTPQKMFNLVSDIKNYPKYLPWCTNSEIKHTAQNEVIGTLHLEYLKIKTSFVTKNINTPFSTIEMYLVDGPFKHLTGLWTFTPLGESGCKIEFNLEYKFSNLILEKLIGPVFNYISKNIVDCFIQEANKQHAN